MKKINFLNYLFIFVIQTILTSNLFAIDFNPNILINRYLYLEEAQLANPLVQFEVIPSLYYIYEDHRESELKNEELKKLILKPITFTQNMMKRIPHTYNSVMHYSPFFLLKEKKYFTPSELFHLKLYKNSIFIFFLTSSEDPSLKNFLTHLNTHNNDLNTTKLTYKDVTLLPQKNYNYSYLCVFMNKDAKTIYEEVCLSGKKEIYNQETSSSNILTFIKDNTPQEGLKESYSLLPSAPIKRFIDNSMENKSFMHIISSEDFLNELNSFLELGK